MATPETPPRKRRVRFVFRSLGGRRDQHRAEHAGATPRPPLRHLVNRLARVAFNDRHLIDGQDREIHLQASFGAIRVVEIDGFKRDRLACTDGFGDFLRQ
jgi:hypothetical protein